MDLPPNYDNDERLPVEQKPVEPVKSITPSDILKDDSKPKFPAEFFQKTLDELQEKYNSLSNKFDESRKTTPKRTVKKTKPKPKPTKSKPKKVEKPSDDEYEVEYEYVDDPQQPQQPQTVQPTIETPQPEPQMYVPYIRRRNIDIRDF